MDTKLKYNKYYQTIINITCRYLPVAPFSLHLSYLMLCFCHLMLAGLFVTPRCVYKSRYLDFFKFFTLVLILDVSYQSVCVVKSDGCANNTFRDQLSLSVVVIFISLFYFFNFIVGVSADHCYFYHPQRCCVSLQVVDISLVGYRVESVTCLLVCLCINEVYYQDYVFITLTLSWLFLAR